MKTTIKHLTQFLLGFAIAYLATYGLSMLILDTLQRAALERRRAIFAQMKAKLFTRENCPHCEHWYNEGLECCLCRMPAKEAEPDEEKETVVEKPIVH